jgi:hypothetical protein
VPLVADAALLSLQDRSLLTGVEVRLRRNRIFRSGAPMPGSLGLQMLSRAARIPHLVQAAADVAGNPSACLLCASLCEARYGLPTLCCMCQFFMAA